MHNGQPPYHRPARSRGGGLAAWRAGETAESLLIPCLLLAAAARRERFGSDLCAETDTTHA